MNRPEAEKIGFVLHFFVSYKAFFCHRELRGHGELSQLGVLGKGGSQSVLLRRPLAFVHKACNGLIF